MIFRDKDMVEWKDVNVLKISDEGPLPHEYYHRIILPEPLASWDVYDYWEKERFISMKNNLNYSDILFDIGTEQGWCNIIYAEFVGPKNMVLIEPTKEFWPNIKETWNKNFDSQPLKTLCALLSDKTTKGYKIPELKDDNVWTEEANTGKLIDRNKYQYIHANTEKIPEIKLDDFIKQSEIMPSALTMDVEGAELLILKGAINTLKNKNLKIWISIHPDLAKESFGIEENEIHDFMKSIGYKGQHLSTDHEEHWYFVK